MIGTRVYLQGAAATAAALAFCLAAPAVAQEGSGGGLVDGWSLSTGIDFSSGDFGFEEGDTDVLYYYGAGEVDIGRLRLRATVPWLRIEGPAGIVGGPGDPIVIDPEPGERRSNSGLGDVVLQAGYLLGSTSSRLPFFELVGKVKVPTADEDKGLGTGKADYSIQVDVFDRFGKVTPFGTIGWRSFGDPEGLELENTLFAGAGISVEASDLLSAGASLDWREATSQGSSDLFELSPFATLRFGSNWRLTGYGVIGLEDGSPDFGGGLMLRFRN